MALEKQYTFEFYDAVFHNNYLILDPTMLWIDVTYGEGMRKYQVPLLNFGHHRIVENGVANRSLCFDDMSLHNVFDKTI